ncbi:hypothetical protein AXF42_Ash002905 [Apostasia shenzhenica]|uniref:Uncharacterized protein n=1 Tax=Apostasia shenzhenica TaxID=1088818 RepID=A0A2I0A7L9_9ASPA|nr:hypothetical protein AXF42_Ash002905 [Apostasia shenzhenica]
MAIYIIGTPASPPLDFARRIEAVAAAELATGFLLALPFPAIGMLISVWVSATSPVAARMLGVQRSHRGTEIPKIRCRRPPERDRRPPSRLLLGCR